MAESPRSFLEGEFGENNIPIAIPLFENGELSDDIFKKIKKPPNSEIKKIPLPPEAPFGSVLAKVETETIKTDKGKGNNRHNILEKIPTETEVAKSKDELQDGLLDLFGDIDVGLNEVMSDLDLNKVDTGPNPSADSQNQKQQQPSALPLISEEKPTINKASKETTLLTEDHKSHIQEEEQKQIDIEEINNIEPLSLDDSITTIPNVFKYLPTLSTGRRDHPQLIRQQTKPDSNKRTPQHKEGITQITSTSSPNTDKSTSEHAKLVEITESQAKTEIVTTKPEVEITQSVVVSEQSVRNIPPFDPDLSQEETAGGIISSVQTSTSISISKTVERHIEIKDSDNVEHVFEISEDIAADTIVGSAAVDSTTIKSVKYDTSDDTGEDTGLLSDNLKKIVRSGITNQDNVDKKAITEELKNIVRSGILDLGILGLWSKDPLPTTHTSPMPVFRPNK